MPPPPHSIFFSLPAADAGGPRSEVVGTRMIEGEPPRLPPTATSCFARRISGSTPSRCGTVCTAPPDKYGPTYKSTESWFP